MQKRETKIKKIADLLKLATIMGIGKVIQRTPHIAHKEATNFPAGVVGAMSPYPLTNHRG